jgi:hypothetical protein
MCGSTLGVELFCLGVNSCVCNNEVAVIVLEFYFIEYTLWLSDYNYTA